MSEQLELIDYLPIGATMFGYYIPATSKVGGFYSLLKDIWEHKGKVANLAIVENNIVVISAPNCEVRDISSTNGGLLIPYPVKKWFQDTFIYSYVKYVSRENPSDNPLNSKKDIVKQYKKSREENPEKPIPPMDPMEIVKVLYSEARNWVIICPFNVIKPEDIVKSYPGDYPIFFEYLKKNLDVIERRNQRRLNGSDSTEDGFSFIDGSWDWMSGEDYEKLGGEIKNSQGIYSLCKKLDGGSIRIYTGKADVMCKRIVGNKENGKWTVGHPTTDPLYEAFDEVRFDTLNFDSFLAAVEKTNTDEEKNAFQEKMLNAIAETAWSIVDELLKKINPSYETETGFNGKALGSSDTASETILKTGTNQEILNYLFDNMAVLRLSDRLEAPKNLKQKISFLGVCYGWMEQDKYKRLCEKTELVNAMYVVKRPVGQQTKLIFSRSYDPQPNDIVRLDIINLSPLMDMIQLFKNNIQNGKSYKANTAALYETVLYALEGVVNHLVKSVFYKNPIFKNPMVEIANTQYDSASKDAFL